MNSTLRLLAATLCLYTSVNSQTQFVKYKGSPVLRVGASSAWDYPGIQTGGFLFDGNVYRMWYGGWSETWWGVGYAISSDGIHWRKYQSNPLLNAKTMWPSSVITDSGLYHMYYVVKPLQDVFQVMHATSSDGISWIPDAQNSPLGLLGTRGSWDDYKVEPRVILKQDSVWKLWYTGSRNGAQDRIGFATSTDKIHWTKKSFQVLGEGAPWETYGVDVGDVIFEQSEYRMWYDGGAEIGYATSSDGVLWSKSTKNPILVTQYTKDDPSDQETFIWLCRVVHVGGVYKMWYDQVPNPPAGFTLYQVALAVDSDSGYVMAHPFQVSFGSVESGSTGITKPVVLMNYGRHAVQVLSLKFASSDFELVGSKPLPLTLAPAARDTILVRFTPKRVGQISDTLRIVSTSATDTVFTVYLSATGNPVTSVAEQGISVESSLGQNFPNPFNPSTAIKYTVSGAGGSGLGARKTKLVIYDLLGREVATLVDEVKAPGSYTVSFEGSGLATGTYLYRLTVGTFVQSRAMLLLK